jgi:hypothetical protein
VRQPHKTVFRAFSKKFEEKAQSFECQENYTVLDKALEAMKERPTVEMVLS